MKTIVLTGSDAVFVFDDIAAVPAICQVYSNLGGSIREETFGALAEKLELCMLIDLFNECCTCDSIRGVYERCIPTWEDEP